MHTKAFLFIVLFVIIELTIIDGGYYMMISLKKIGTLVLFILSISILSRCDFFHQQATITFETNGGTEVLPLTQDRGSKIDVTTIKEGYVFDAWCSDEGLTTSIDIRTMPNSNLTVYAKWVTMHERFTIDNKPYVYYGTYPQTVVSDDSLIASLNTLTVTNSNYYYEYQGKEYVKIVATPYIPPYFYKFNDGTKILAGQTYFFKVEPIKWRVLEEASGTYTLLSEYIIDNQVFYTSLEDRTISGETIYANNYEHSTIREWLNNGFYNQAFSALEKDEILTSFVDNSAETTGSSPNLYVSNNTYDKTVVTLNRREKNTI